ncbi:MAG: GxxExxY protein [Candidatus Omnitrophica bacterium]|nr:GxxExxY protein [Candidatus Omnitrophota bacterium]
MKIDDPLTHKIIGCAMNVHNELGYGFQEVIYQRALEIEFKHANVNYFREHEIPILYREQQIGTRRVDFLVENRIMVEIKALAHLEEVHLVQGLNYIEAFNIKTGLLLNFGARKLEFKRLLNKKI